ncbi:MAG: LptA/OstA family protein [Maricaulaceae bacterium]|jgi:lipopolysaccharide export system protein LptA
MRILVSIIAGAAALLVAAPACAQFSGQSGDIAFGADTTEAAGNVVRLIGRANVWQGEARLMADRLDIYFGEDTPGAARAVQRIEATGSVAYITPVERALGDEGVFVAATDTVTLTGRVILIQGETVLTGNRLVVQSQSGHAALTSDPGERIRGVLSTEGEAPVGFDADAQGAGAGGRDDEERQ